MAENPFRILLDFRELNFKFYKFVWMSISPREILTIKDLKDALLKKFSFERTDLLLFLRDGFLPEDENISNILRENDSVRLFYAEPSNVNLSDSRTINNERDEESPNDNQEKSTRKRKEHSDVSEDDNEQTESSKKRKHSFSNGTYLFKNNSIPENSAFISAVSDDIENVTYTNLSNFENSRRSKSCKIKKKLKYSHDVSQNSLVSGNEIALSSDIIPMSEKNQSKINSCKKKKKHKHSKDLSESELILFDDIATMSEINENKSRSHKKKKKRKHSHDTSKIVSVSESAVSFHDETIGTAKKLNNSANDLKTGNELSELQESIFYTVTDDSEVLTIAPNSFCASSVATSSGIGYSLKTSQESNKKISSEPDCSKSHVSFSKSIPETEENNLSVSQGNNCKKKKRKRHRKRKSLLISPQVDASNDYNLDITSPKKNENLDSHFTSPSYQTPGISPKNKETSDNSKSNAFYSKRNTNCLETKSSFMEQFGKYLPSTSTPFSQTRTVSPRKNVISKIPTSSNASEYQSCSVKTYMNAVLPAIQKKTVQSFLSTHSSPYSIPSESKENATTPNRNFDKSLSNQNNSEKSTDSGSIVKAANSQTDEQEIELELKGRIGKSENFYKVKLCSSEVVRKNKNDLPVHSSPCSAANNKSNATTPNRNSHDKSLSTKINNSDKSTDSSSNIGIKSRFLDPSFSYKGCPPLNSCPLVDTRIAYKILELDSSYSPVVSNYKEGVVKAINPETDELEIELIQPEVKEGRIGKFENIYNYDEFPACEVIRKVTLSWPSLIDPVQVIY